MGLFGFLGYHFLPIFGPAGTKESKYNFASNYGILLFRQPQIESLFTIGVTNNDFSASKKIWEFFMQCDINGRILASEVNDLNAEEISVFPNPTTNKLAVKGFP